MKGLHLMKCHISRFLHDHNVCLEFYTSKSKFQMFAYKLQLQKRGQFRRWNEGKHAKTKMFKERGR